MKTQGFHYSVKTLKAVKGNADSKKSEALANVERYLSDEFARLDIPNSCIKKAFDACFSWTSSQSELNRDVKNYLLKNLSSM